VDTTVFHRRFRSQAWRDAILGEESHKKILLYVGRLVWEKNLKLLARVINDLYAERDDMVMVFVGTGPAEEELRAMMPKAIFLGFKAGHELSEVYASSDIFVFPSDTETFGNVTLEAMASGLPSVVANAGGSADLVHQHKTGFKLHPQNVEEWKSTIYSLLNDRAKQETVANAAFEQAQKYRWESILTEMHTFYANIQREYRQQTNRYQLPMLLPRTKLCNH
jgi:phosphatidylinositol alpha 1,6-mannosyltransferase